MNEQHSNPMSSAAPSGADNESQADPSGASRRRPIAVWIIFAICTLQLLTILIFMHKSHYFDAVRAGAIAPISAFFGFLYPFLFFLGGVLLLLLRKAAIVVFGIYLGWGILKVVSGTTHGGVLDLVLAAGILAYCWQLRADGKLSRAAR